MGAGVSTSIDDSQWRSERAKELDKLGGADRQAVRRGDSFKYKLEWLQGALVKQGEDMEAALAKDPMAGRHEIAAQEVRKAVRASHLPAANANGLKLSVRDWQNANHTELRARIMLEQRKPRTLTPTTNSLRPTGKAATEPGFTTMRDKEPESKARMRDYYLNMEATRNQKAAERTQQIAATYAAYSPKPHTAGPAGEGEGGGRSGGALGWRDRVLAAKKTAFRTLNVALAFRSSQRMRRKGPARLDSFSFLIANQLGDDAPRYTVEAAKLATTTQAIEDLQAVMKSATPTTSLQKHDVVEDETAHAPTVQAPVQASKQPNSPMSARNQANMPSHAAAFKPGRSRPVSVPVPGPRPGNQPASPTGSPARNHLSSMARPETSQASRPAGSLISGTTPRTGQRKSVTMVVTEPIATPSKSAGSSYLADAQALSRMASRKSSHGGSRSDGESAAKRIVDAEATAQRTRKMMSLYTHRCNARWAEAQSWDVPPVTHLLRLASEANGGQVAVFRELALRALKEGKVAVQLFVGDETVQLSSAHPPYDLWSTDPWPLIRMLLPTKAEGLDALAGVAMGPRLLLGLATAVENVAGPEAVKKLHVIIHCSETQESCIASDLATRAHFGLNPANVLLVPQQTRHGYVWDVEQQRFVSTRERLRSMRSMRKSNASMNSRASSNGAVRTSRSESGALKKGAARPTTLSSNGNEEAIQKGVNQSQQLGGTGYCMMQLGWEGEAMLVGETGETTPLPGSVMDYLQSRNVSWMLTRRLRDLALYDPSTALEPDALAAMLYLHEADGATAAVWVDMGASIQAAAAGQVGIVLGHKDHTLDSQDTRQACQLPNMKNQPHKNLQPSLPVVDLEPAALVSPKLAGLLTEIKNRSKGAGLPASTQKYLWHLPALNEALQQPVVLRPVLTVKGACTHVSFDATQLTASSAIKCAALCAGPRHTAKYLSGSQDVEVLMSSMQAQDASGTFRRLLATTARDAEVMGPDGRPLSLLPSTDQLGDAAALKARSWAGKRVVLLVKDTEATTSAIQLLLALLRPGRDMLLLMGVSTGGLSGENAMRAALMKYIAIARRAAVDCAAEMIPKLGEPLLQLIEDYTENAEADLVVLGSRRRTSGGCQAMGSVAYSLMKALSCPMLVVKAEARNADIAWEKDSIRLMVQVDHSSRGLLRWAASRLLQANRQDKVLLAWPTPENQVHKKQSDDQIVMAKRMLDNFSDILFNFHLTGVRKVLEGGYATAGVAWADSEKAHIMAIHAPPGKALPETVLRLLNSTRSALLLYKGGANEPL